MSAPRENASNGLGLAGFIVSLVGFVTCLWVICPIGLLLSFFGLFKKPRGLAIAGFIIGLLGSLWIILIIAFFAMMGIGLAAASSMGLGLFEVTTDTLEINKAVKAHYSSNSALPSTLEILTLDRETVMDPWGEFYRYEIDPDGRRYTISTAGPDGIWDTEDDFALDQDVLAP